MTSERALGAPDHAFVWIWLPDASEPVVCGRLDHDGDRIAFTYGRSYLARPDAVPVFEPELPLVDGPQWSIGGGRLPVSIDDAMPDSWGRALVRERLGRPNVDVGDLVYLLQSGSDRFGALDFQLTSTEYVARNADHPTIDDLAAASERIEAGEPLDDALRAALLDGTALGGARPKALLFDGDVSTIAKFTSSRDPYPVVQGEFVAMELARRCGLDVAPVRLTKAAGRHALLVDRFDRSPTGGRRRAVTALSLLGMNPWPDGRYATYHDLADRIRARFVDPDATLRELYARISFSMLCGNTDDHGRNHAAFVLADERYALAPAFDVCPQLRSGEAAAQAMAYGADARESNVNQLRRHAHVYHLDGAEAAGITERQVTTIRDHWQEVCDRAELTVRQRDAFMGVQFLNEGALR